MNWNPDIGIPLAIGGILLLIAMAIFGRPRKPEQGRRTGEPGERGRGSRREPRFGEGDEETLPEIRLGDLDSLDADPRAIQEELELIDRTLAAAPETSLAAGEVSPSEREDGTERRLPPESQLGRRGDVAPQRIVTLFVTAREGESIDGASIAIAAEKAGLVYGHMGIFHRLVDGRPEAEPVFSVANLVAPGHFDLRRVNEIETPGLTFFMTLPGPMSALDAWEAMLPTAQRMAELLDASVLDEQHNTLGRQRIAHLRDELRSFDREQEKEARRPW